MASMAKANGRRSVKKREKREKSRRANKLRVCATGSGDYAEGEGDEEPPELTMDWREFRARLVARETEDGSLESSAVSSSTSEAATDKGTAEGSGGQWAHVLAAPESGCLLVAKPVEFTGQEYFNRAVILVLEHTFNGSIGLILNEPSGRVIGDISGEGEPFRGSEHPMYFGGDVGQSSDTLVLHDKQHPSAIEIVPGCYLSNLEECQQLIDQCILGQSNMRVFVGYCGWGPNQLEDEVQAGAWWPCACSAKAIFNDHTQDKGGFSKSQYWWHIVQLCGGSVLEQALRETDQQAE